MCYDTVPVVIMEIIFSILGFVWDFSWNNNPFHLFFKLTLIDWSFEKNRWFTAILAILCLIKTYFLERNCISTYNTQDIKTNRYYLKYVRFIFIELIFSNDFFQKQNRATRNPQDIKSYRWKVKLLLTRIHSWKSWCWRCRTVCTRWTIYGIERKYLLRWSCILWWCPTIL